jgi:hypothetical protein
MSAPATVPAGTATAPPATSIPEPSPSAAAPCPALDAAFQPSLDLSFLVGHADNLHLAITSIVLRADPSLTFRPAPPKAPEENLVLPGGVTLPAELWLGYWGSGAGMLDPAADLVALDARIQPAGGQEVPLATTTTKHNRSYRLLAMDAIPDLDGRATLRLSADWTDRCFTYAAEGTFEVAMVSSAARAGCPVDSNPDTFWNDLTATFEPPLRVGPGEIDIFWRWAAARYLPIDGPGGDGPAPVQLWSRNLAPIVAGPGAVLTVSEANEHVQLLTMQAVVHRRADVVAALDGPSVYPFPNVPVVSDQTVWRAPDGSFALEVPSEPGDYVVWLSFGFDATCATGTAWAVTSVTVQAGA